MGHTWQDIIKSLSSGGGGTKLTYCCQEIVILAPTQLLPVILYSTSASLIFIGHFSFMCFKSSTRCSQS